MSDIMRIQPFATQLRRILKEYEANSSHLRDSQVVLLHAHAGRADSPRPTCTVSTSRHRSALLPARTRSSARTLSRPGSCGGRFIELKTVQIMDELEIPRPCIDMEDEGYNVEWSQELKLEESAQEYINAWALLHILPRCWVGKARHQSAPSST